MKKSRHTDSQILEILKQAETGTPVPQLHDKPGQIYLSPQPPSPSCRILHHLNFCMSLCGGVGSGTDTL